MTSDTRREALVLLTEVWELSPDVRLGQLLAHLGFLGEAHLGHGLGDIDDDEIVAILNLHKAELKRRLEGVGQSAIQKSSGVPAADNPAIPVSSPAAAANR